MKSLTITLSGGGWGVRGRDGWAIQPMYNVSLFEIVTMNSTPPPHTTNIS
jgi:hypothetical protein